MDLDHELISLVVRGGTPVYLDAKKQGVTKKILSGPSVEAWDFLDHHFAQHSQMPSEEFFVAKGQWGLIDASEPLTVYIEELRKRVLWRRLSQTYEDIGEKLEARDPDGALKLWVEVTRDTRSARLAASKIESLLISGEEAVNYYERIKAGERGVLSPWASINDTTLGFWPGDFILFVARSEVGKTWCLLQLARKAWMDGKRVLFVGTEMAKLKLQMRFFSLHFKLPYEDFRHGRLGLEKEKQFRDGVKDLMDQEGLYIVGDDFNPEMSDIEAAVDEIEPDVLFIDGLYLVKNKGRDMYERVSQNANDVKLLAKSRGLPLVATHQLNRAAGEKNPRDVSLANISMSDVLVFNADYIIAMVSLEDDRDDKIMHWKWLKTREGYGKPFVSNWDFDNMDFEQMARQDDEEFGDDEDYESSPKPESGEEPTGEWLF